MEVFGFALPTNWIEPILLGLQVLMILLAGYLAQRLIGRFITRLGERYPLPPELLMPVRGG